MARPTTTVEVAFDAGYTGTPTWTDVTAYVFANQRGQISITRGRADEDGECGPNSLSLVFNNADGRFTPGNTSSPYYPNVRKGRRIRVTSTHNGTDYDRFTGYINDWRVSWPGKVSSVADCAVTASSRLARLGNGTELRSIVEETILQDTPSWYYTLGEPEDAPSAADTSSNAVGSLVPRGSGTAVVFGNATGPGTDGLTAAQFAGGQFLGHAADTALIASSFTIEAFFSTSSAAADQFIVRSPVHPTWGYFEIVTEASGAIRATIDTATVTSATGYADGEVHHVAATFRSTPSAEMLFYIDGELIGTDNGTVGRLISGTLEAVGAGLTGAVSHVATYNDDLTADQIAAHVEAGATGFTADTPADRLERYAAFAGVVVADTDFETGQVPDLAHIDTTGKTALSVMREVEVTEGGVLFDAPDGTLTFHDRAHRYGAASAFTLSYSSGEVTDALEPLLDDQQMSNDVTATNSDGVTAHVVDTDSIDENGPYRQSLDLATTDPDEPLVRASWLVNRLAEPTERISALEVLLNAAGTTLTTGLLAADVGTKLTLSGLPSNAPASSMSLFVEGVSESITADSHRISLRTSPAELYNVFILDDATYGDLDGVGVLAY